MNEQCSIGISLQDECHKTTFGMQSVTVIVDENSLHILSLRTGIKKEEITTICTHHEKQFISYFSRNIHKCCDLLNVHKKPARSNLCIITLDHHAHNSQLIPGKKICSKCLKSLFKPQDALEDENSNDYVPDRPDIEAANISLSYFNESPIKSKLSTPQVIQKLESKKRKIQEAVTSPLQKISEVGTSKQKVPDDKEKEEVLKKADSMDKLVTLLKEKFHSILSYEEKVKLLTLVPHHWTIEKTVKEFNSSQYIVRAARDLKEKSGILGKRKTNSGQGRFISEGVKEKILQFYESEQNGRVLPGKKDFVSVKTINGREQKQKHLLLCNLKELYEKWLEQFPNEEKVGFSSFANLKPKWCILAGAAGTHNICVCIHHQNPKLKLAALPIPNLSYKSLIELCVCDVNSQNCMFHTCNACPGQEIIEATLLKLFYEDDLTENIDYKQWISTDRCSLKTVTEPINEFISCFSLDIWNLTIHHFITKSQTKSLKDIKAGLAENEILILLDFAENYSFVTQDAIQSSYWTNQQATLHPCVVYYQEGGSLKSKSFCIISDSLLHDVNSVYAFQANLVPLLKEILPQLNKVIYFSDGCAAQYKNR